MNGSPRLQHASRDRLNSVSQQFKNILKECTLCPRMCRVNRLTGRYGYCKSGRRARIASYTLHHGEEPPLSGHNGSGTVFFSGCTLHCVFCQNYPISHFRNGEEFDSEQLADAFMNLAHRGAHNINLVTPTHFLPMIIEALLMAREQGLSIPIVYNSGGFERIEILNLLSDIVDIYMPDAKYATRFAAEKYSDAVEYPTVNRTALVTMYNQAGNLVCSSRGIAVKGLIIRHLVMPGNSAETDGVLRFIKESISPQTYISLMAQYHPAHRAYEYPELSRTLTHAEYERACKRADQYGLHNGWRQVY
ncbi:MAG: radical SAM protein [Elusimicrobia bacterium]|nr:radical SAM protein [Elusimicrobiota bacterium]